MLTVAVFFALLQAQGETSPAPQLPGIFEASFTPAAVRVDGLLDDPVWREAPSYALHLPLDRGGEAARPQAGGSVQLAHGQGRLYVALNFTDRDVVNEAQEDQGRLYEQGDTAEVFLKPEGARWYWELYVTPHGKKSTFWFPSQGRLGLPSNFAYAMELEAAAHVRGTLNQWRDTDQGWTGEMAIPVRELERHGDAFPGKGWRILISRYNYSVQLEGKGAELTAAPRLPRTDFHLLDAYAPLRLAPPPAHEPTGSPAR